MKPKLLWWAYEGEGEVVREGEGEEEREREGEGGGEGEGEGVGEGEGEGDEEFEGNFCCVLFTCLNEVVSHICVNSKNETNNVSFATIIYTQIDKYVSSQSHSDWHHLPPTVKTCCLRQLIPTKWCAVPRASGL